MHSNDDDTPERTAPVDDATREYAAVMTTVRTGSTFGGRYRIARRIGGGGSGEVWEAHDLVADAVVALKILYPSPTSDRTLDRLRRELRILRQIDHPGVIDVHDIGSAGGLLYVVMERLRGETLRDRIRTAGHLSAEESIDVFASVLEALAVAHDRGVLHRDLKPANVFLVDRPDEQHPRVVLLDFGLARGMDDLTLTATGATLGTPHYMAPEQARGQEASKATDLYGCGVMLWEMLSGKLPFTGDTPLSVLQAHVEQPLPRRDARLSGTPEWLQWYTRWLLHKDPARRPEDAGEALRALREGARSVDRSVPRRLRRMALMSSTRDRRSRTVRVFLAATVVLLLAASLGLPVRVTSEGPRVTTRSLLGVPLRSAEAPQDVREITRIHPWWQPWKPRWLTLLWNDDRRPPYTAPFDSGLALYDPPRGELRPFSDHQSTGMRRLEYEPFVPDFSIGQVEPLRGRDVATGEPLVRVDHGHIPWYPSILRVATASGVRRFEFRHPGRISHVVEFTGAGHDTPLLLAVGLNTRLGGVPFAAAIDLRDLQVGAPPFDDAKASLRRPTWYTFFPRYEMSAVRAAFIEGDDLVVEVGSSRRHRIDARTGVPRDPALRDDLDEGSWWRSARGLIESLDRAAMLERSGDPRSGAEQLVSLGRDGTFATTHRQIAELQAARMFLRAGLPDLAEDAVDLAIGLERDVLGSWKIKLRLVILRGAPRSEVSRLLADAHPDIAHNRSLRGGLFFAYCEGGRFEDARQEFANVLDQQQHEWVYRFLGGTLSDLMVRDFESASSRLADPAILDDHDKLLPEFDLLRAIVAIGKGRPTTDSTVLEPLELASRSPKLGPLVDRLVGRRKSDRVETHDFEESHPLPEIPSSLVGCLERVMDVVIDR